MEQIKGGWAKLFNVEAHSFPVQQTWWYWLNGVGMREIKTSVLSINLKSNPQYHIRLDHKYKGFVVWTGFNWLRI
jgi:hypothetical protein